MTPSQLFSFCFLLLVVDLSDGLVLGGKHERRTAAELREFQRLKRSKTNKIHRDFVPDFPDEPLVITIPIGTPADEKDPTTFRMALETGSSQTWVLGTKYGDLSRTNQPFDPAASTSAERLGLFLGTNDEVELTGDLYVDVLDLNVMDEGLVFNQTFGVVDSATEFEYPYGTPQFPADGVLGLGWNVLAVPDDPDYTSELVHNILHRAKDVKAGNYFYTLWLDNPTNKRQKENWHRYDWYIQFGLTEHEHCERHFNLTFLSEFSTRVSGVFQFESFRFGDYSVDISDQYLNVDTGSPVIFMPTDAYEAVWTLLQPDYDWDTGFYVMDCNQTSKLDDWSWTFTDDVVYSIPAATYLMDVGLDDGQCMLALAESGDPMVPQWTLGNPFVIEHCVLFDTGTNMIGFARSKTSSASLKEKKVL